MKTPAGSECPYFYGNYYRGKELEECRLIGPAAPPHHWTRDLCRTCPVPAIQRANACENMTLRGEVKRKGVAFKRKMQVKAFCTLSQKAVDEPEIGCGKCHDLSALFEENS